MTFPLHFGGEDMTISATIARASTRIEAATRLDEFLSVARCATLGRGVGEGAAIAEGRGLGRIAELLRKAAVPPVGLSNSPEFQTLAMAFLESLGSAGAFDRMLPDMLRVPMRTRIAAVTLNATGYIVGEGAPKPISSLSFTGGQLPVHTVAAINVLTEELVRAAGAEATSLFRRQLTAAVAEVTDERFLSLVTASAPTVVSNGGTSLAVHQDFQSAFSLLATDAASRIHIIMQSANAKALATKVTIDGTTAFPQMTAQGGTLFGAPVIVSDGVQNGTIVVLDAAAVAASIGELEFSDARHATLQMSDSPDSPAIASSVLESLWQHDRVALRLVRSFGAFIRSANSAVVITSANYATGNSPA